MSVHVKAGDAWKTCKSVHVNVSGTWKQCKQVYVNVSGTWKPCILVSGSKTVNVGGPFSSDKKVSLSNVKNGSTIKITGYHSHESGGTMYALKATGATLPSAYGSYDNNGWRVYPNIYSMNYTLNLTATSTSVSITFRMNNGSSSSTNTVITYTEEYYP